MSLTALSSRQETLLTAWWRASFRDSGVVVAAGGSDVPDRAGEPADVVVEVVGLGDVVVFPVSVGDHAEPEVWLRRQVGDSL